MRTTRELKELAREVPWRDLDRAAVDRVRANLREAALAAPPRASMFRDHRRTLAAVALTATAIASAAAVVMFAVDFGEQRVRNELAQPEIVRLTDGHIQVRASEHKDRPMRIVIGDAEIEARAADFEVYAENDRVIAVFAATGMVEVKRFGVTPMVVQPGVRWEPARKLFQERRLLRKADAKRFTSKNVSKVIESRVIERPATEPTRIEPTTIEPPLLAPAVEPAADTTADETPPITEVPVHVPIVAAPEPESDERNFQKGWVSYQAELYEEAARYFARVDPQGAWGEDALYWRIHAVLRLEPKDGAAPLLRLFLEKYRTSPRRGELSVTLGWALLHDGKTFEARKLFKAAAEDPSADVRESARRGYVEAED